MILWKVDDNPAQGVMTLFYNNLASEKTKSQAFDDTQETLYQKYKNSLFLERIRYGRSLLPYTLFITGQTSIPVVQTNNKKCVLD